MQNATREAKRTDLRVEESVAPKHCLLMFDQAAKGKTMNHMIHHDTTWVMAI